MSHQSLFTRLFVYSFIGLLGYLFIGLFPPLASGEVMTNDTYTVQKRTVQIQPFITESPRPKQQTEKPLASGANYTVTTNNQAAFSFSTSPDNISFGTLQATNPVIREMTFGITSSRGYQILAAAGNPLRKTDGAFIPDTTCDNGSCSEFTPAPWLNTLTYGFGYRTSGMETDYYQQFADLSRKEVIQPVFKGLQAQNVSEKLTYRINISATQSPGSYSNSIFYIATPDF